MDLVFLVFLLLVFLAASAAQSPDAWEIKVHDVLLRIFIVIN